MANKYTCVFSLDRRSSADGIPITENVPIYADISFKQRLRYPTGYRIDVERWIDEKRKDEKTGEVIRIQQVKRNCYGTRDKKPIAYNFINDDLKLIQFSLYELFRDNQSVTKEMIISLLDRKLKKTKNRVEVEADEEEKVDTSLWGLFALFTKEPSVTAGTRQIFNNAYNTFKHFEESRKHKITFEECTPRLISEFDEFMKRDDNRTGKYDHIPLRQRPNIKGHNTRLKVIKTLFTFFRWAAKNYGITVIPFENYKKETENYDDPVYLTIAERESLYNFTPSKPYLERVRDMFYVQCCVGCRVGDFQNLSKANLKNDEDGVYLEYAPKKTIREKIRVCRIPLSSKVQGVIAKYDFPDGRLLPYISSQKYNEYIGELLKEAGLNRKVMVTCKVTFKSEYKPLYELITSHSARKTFIDIHMKKGVSESVIASMSGHVKGSRAFHRYYHVDDAQRREAIKVTE